MSKNIPSADELRLLNDLAGKFPWLVSASDPRKLRTVHQLVDAYLADAANELGDHYLDIRKRHLDHFRSEFGPRLCAELAGHTLKKWINANRKRYRSAWSRLGLKSSIVRCFSWGVENGFILENPIRGIKMREARPTGRAMTDDEFQALMREADPALRRMMIALKWTGARPAELTALRWEHIDWEQRVARLSQHKTAAKSDRPRILIFTEPIMRLLAFLRRTRRLPLPLEMKQLLEAQPGRFITSRGMIAHFRAKGPITYRRLYQCRLAIGAVMKTIGGKKCYHLPEDPKPTRKNRPWAKSDFDAERVFTCDHLTPWTRSTLTLAFARARRRAGLKGDCKLYGLRHQFVTNAVRANLNLKVVATIVGHSDSRMVDRVYAHVHEDFEVLREGAKRATGG